MSGNKRYTLCCNRTKFSRKMWCDTGHFKPWAEYPGSFSVWIGPTCWQVFAQFGTWMLVRTLYASVEQWRSHVSDETKVCSAWWSHHSVCQTYDKRPTGLCFRWSLSREQSSNAPQSCILTLEGFKPLYVIVEKACLDEVAILSCIIKIM